MFGEVELFGGQQYIVIDTTEVNLPIGGRLYTITELVVPEYAPISSYTFTGYVFNNVGGGIYDEDSFDFSVIGCAGMNVGGNNNNYYSQIWYGGNPFDDWNMLSGWFQEYVENNNKDLGK
jgi:hypothetical protein